jgi:hypothetical protein
MAAQISPLPASPVIDNFRKEFTDMFAAVADEEWRLLGCYAMWLL